MSKYRWQPEEIERAAKARGWYVRSHQPEIYCLILRRGTEQVNVYYSKMTVGTTVDHPKRGRNQMFRRNVSDKLLEQILDRPRVHTRGGESSGYRSIEQYERNFLSRWWRNWRK